MCIPVRVRAALLCAVLALGAVACAAPPAGTGTPAATPPALPAPGRTAPPMSDPLPPLRQPDAPPALDDRCKRDADCAIKDVGNCCGAQPACVNKDSRTDHAAVRAQCAKQGMTAVCGFVEIKACSCRQGRCAAVPASP